MPDLHTLSMGCCSVANCSSMIFECVFIVLAPVTMEMGAGVVTSHSHVSCVILMMLILRHPHQIQEIHCLMAGQRRHLDGQDFAKVFTTILMGSC